MAEDFGHSKVPRRGAGDRSVIKDAEMLWAAIGTAVFASGWVVFAVLVWQLPWFWEVTFDDRGFGDGVGLLAILLTGLAIYPGCYSTLFLTWAFLGRPNEARATEQIGGIHLTHVGLLWFWLMFVIVPTYSWWGMMFGIITGDEGEYLGWAWALFVPALLLTALALSGPFWGLFFIFHGTEGARNPPPSEALTQTGTMVQINCGGGLNSELWDNKDLSGEPELTGVDPNIDINWGGGGPPGAGSDQFSIRWTGYIIPRETGSYTFETSNDDGVRLWVDGTLLIDEWYDQAGKHSAPIDFEAGEAYDFRMEYYENGGAAKAKLRWTKPDGTYEIVPCAVFSPTKPDTPSTVILSAAASGELITDRLNWWD